MTQQKLHVTQPAPLSLEAIQKPLVVGKESLICWCPQSRFGGIYFLEAALWHTFGPFDGFENFRTFLARSFPEAVEPLH